jgi:hypothetical protein
LSDGDTSIWARAVVFTGSPNRVHQFWPVINCPRCKIDMALE